MLLVTPHVLVPNILARGRKVLPVLGLLRKCDHTRLLAKQSKKSDERIVTVSLLSPRSNAFGYTKDCALVHWKMGEYSRSQEYQSFRSSISFKRIVVDDDTEKSWGLYDVGPRNVRCPLIFLPPASGTADIFFKQMLPLSTAGYRVISLEYPVYWNLREFCQGFRRLLDHLQLDKVHVFGASLGGFLIQKFCELTYLSPRVESLILCNTFMDTTVFRQTSSAPTFWMMPAVVLKKMVMGNFDKGLVEKDIADSIDFMVDKLDSLGQQDLASRLTLNCMNAYIEPQKLRHLKVTIMDVYDESALSQGVREEVYKCYPDARRAHLKSGGNFPYLSRSDEVNIYIQIHLRQFLDTRYSAMEPRPEILQQLKEAESNSTVNSPEPSTAMVP